MPVPRRISDGEAASGVCHGAVKWPSNETASQSSCWHMLTPAGGTPSAAESPRAQRSDRSSSRYSDTRAVAKRRREPSGKSPSMHLYRKEDRVLSELLGFIARHPSRERSVALPKPQVDRNSRQGRGSPSSDPPSPLTARARTARRATRPRAELPGGVRCVRAMSRHPCRQELAREYGATDLVTGRGAEGIARTEELTRGVGADAGLECVGRRSRCSRRAARRNQVPLRGALRAPVSWPGSA